MHCKNCNTELNSNFCPVCGPPESLNRIDGRYLVHEIGQVLNLERGVFYTIRELLLRPGQSIRNYLAGDRDRFVKPIVFILITSLLYTLCNHLFQFEEQYVRHLDARMSVTTEIFQWIQSHYGYSNIIMGIFIALWLKLFFRRHNVNFF